jgi:VWFA-related protein
MGRSRWLWIVALCFISSIGWAQQSVNPTEPSQKDPILTHRPPPKAPVTPGAISPEGRVHLDVVVDDASGKPVPGLGPQDFTLLDEGQPKKILSFRSYDGVNVKASPPVEVILVVDTVNLPFGQIAFTREEITKFLRQNGGHLANPTSIFLLSEAGLRVQPRPSVDGNALVTVVDQIKGSVHGINAAMGADGDLQRFQLSVRQMATIAENEATVPGRKLLIWVGPGWPMVEGDNFLFTDKDRRTYFDIIVELSAKLREARMSVYSVAPSESTTGNEIHTMRYRDYLKGVPSAKKADTGNLALKVLVLQSGGRILGPDNDVAGQINSCIADANSFYRVSFNPSPTEHANEYHDLKVQVSQPGLTTRTNTGYYNQPQQGTSVP